MLMLARSTTLALDGPRAPSQRAWSSITSVAAASGIACSRSTPPSRVDRTRSTVSMPAVTSEYERRPSRENTRVSDLSVTRTAGVMPSTSNPISEVIATRPPSPRNSGTACSVLSSSSTLFELRRCTTACAPSLRSSIRANLVPSRDHAISCAMESTGHGGRSGALAPTLWSAMWSVTNANSAPEGGLNTTRPPA
jgi:hypothetical protein